MHYCVLSLFITVAFILLCGAHSCAQRTVMVTAKKNYGFILVEILNYRQVYLFHPETYFTIFRLPIVFGKLHFTDKSGKVNISRIYPVK